MNAMVAVRHSGVFMEGQGVKSLRTIVEGSWHDKDGNWWSFTSDHEDFLVWVRNGFLVTCVRCFQQHNVVTCGHVEFPATEKVAAYSLAKAIKMGLV